MERTPKLEHLSARERQIAAAYAGGQSYREIAERLFIAPTTVRTHLSTIYRKLGVSTKIELLRTLERCDGAPDAGAIMSSSSCDDAGEAIASEGEGAPLAAKESADDLAPAGPELQAFAPVEIAPSAERRHLTIAFVDLAGSMEFATQLDPEQMRDLLAEFQAAVAAAVARFEGHVTNVMGDEVLVYFGWPHAHEDDAERAIRASLAARASVGALRGPEGGPLAARIGIASGLVVIGESMGHDAAAIGDTPNLASRLRTLAGPGQIVIAGSTRRLLGDIFELTDLGANSVAGMSEPLQVFAVTDERPLESRFEARSGLALLPMVGRDQELALLLERWALAKAGEGQGVLLVGEAGIGKSRIGRALLDTLAEEPHTRIRYQCSPYYTDSALWPVVQQLTYAAGLGGNDATETKLDKLEALLARAGSPTDTAPLIADLLGLDGVPRYGRLDLTPQAQRAHTLEALVGQLLGLAARQPALVIFEDAHWIDPTTLELIEQCLDRIAAARVLILLTSRPDEQPALAGHPHVTRLTLNRLGQAGVAAIVARLGGDHLPSEVIDAIIARTDGVPLFVEELTKAVLESGDTAVPASLYDSLMARLDRIPAVKEIAQIAACIGREFDYPLLAAIVDRPEHSLQSALDQLAAAELIFRRGMPPNASYTFKHALVQDTAYASLLKARRQQIHFRLVQVLGQRGGAVRPEILAQHANEAGLTESAINQWQEAGGRAIARSAYREAISHLTSAIRLIWKMGDARAWRERELRLQIELGQALIAARGYAAEPTVRAFERALDLAEDLGNTPLRVRALFGQWVARYTRAQPTADLVARFADVAAAMPDAGPRLVGMRMLALEHYHRGRFAEAQELLEQAVALYDPKAHRHLGLEFAHDPRAVSLVFQCWTLWHLGYPDQAYRAGKDAIAWAHQLDYANTIGIAECWGGLLPSAFARHIDRVEPRAHRLIDYADEMSMSLWRAWSRIFLGWALAHRGQPEDGLREIVGGLAESRKAGAERTLPILLGLFAEAEFVVGNSDAAMARIEEAFAAMERTEDVAWAAELHRIRAHLLLQGSVPQTERAEADLSRAIEIARGQQAKSLELRAATSLARLWTEQGEQRKAFDLLAPVYDWFTEGFDTPDLIDAKELLDGLP